MLADVTIANWPAVVIAFIGGIPFIITGIIQVISARRQKVIATEVQEVHAEIKTGNDLTMGQLAADAESRRIQEVPITQRSDAERKHVEESTIAESFSKPLKDLIVEVRADVASTKEFVEELTRTMVIHLRDHPNGWDGIDRRKR